MSARPITEEDLNGYVDRRLDAAREAEVAVWLDAHPEAARRIARQTEERDLLRAALAPIAEEPVPPELNLKRMIETHRRPNAFAGWGNAAAAAIVLLVVGGAGGWTMRGAGLTPSEGVQSLSREAVASFAAYAPDTARPVELRERAPFEAWAAKRIGRSIAIPDLAASGYRFMGGRIVPTEHGPAAMVMYDDDRGARLVLLARTMAADQNAPMAPHSEDGINGYAWADQGLGYSLVGSAPASALHPIADEARRQIRSRV